MRWNRAEPTPRIDPAEIHVWRVPLDVTPDPDRVAEALSERELRRAERFRVPLHRRRWCTAQLALRSILGSYLDRPAGAVDFAYGPYGKPGLDRKDAVPDLRFNLTHSAGLALVAVTLGREIGIDLEQRRPDRPVVDLARRWFAPEESAAVLELPADERATGFFACWTRKEAVIKAEGLTVPAALKRFTVPVGPLDGPVETRGPERTWSLASLEVDAGFAAALACEASASGAQGFRWSP